MNKVAFLNDIDLCIGCFACEAACKQEHDLPVGVKLIQVVRVGPEEINGRLVMDMVPMHCRHCENPPCLKACPVEAISKRADGIVIYDMQVCIGCKQCIEACPFGAAQYDPVKQRARACDLCYERVDEGLLPSCVQHCPTGTLVVGDPADYTRRRREARARPFLYRRFPDANSSV